MGMAVDGTRLSVGGSQPCGSTATSPPWPARWTRRAATTPAILPRRLHVTGDIDVHEMAYGPDDELWVVNTRFCCLCTLEADHSFVPRWRPPFVTRPGARRPLPSQRAGAGGRPPQVRHRAGRDRHAAAAGGRNKASGGVLMDVETSAIVLRGLSMPHSPRWYQRPALAAWNPGRARLARADPARGHLADRGPAAGLHPRPRLLRAAGLHRAVAGARERGVQRHSAGRAGQGAQLWRVGGASGDRRDRGLSALRGGRAGDFRRAGAARPALSRGAGVGG